MILPTIAMRRNCGRRGGGVHMALPSGISPGAIIGPGGDNVKWIKTQTGVSHIGVENTGIILRGSASSMTSAQQILTGQISALMTRTGTVPMNTRVIFLGIRDRYDALQIVQGSGSTGRGQEGPLRIRAVEQQCVSAYGSNAASREVDGLETMLNMMPTLTDPIGSSRKGTKGFYSASDYRAAVSGVSATARDVHSHGVTMKIRGNFGTQGFKWARDASLGYSLQNLDVAQAKYRDELLLPKWGNGVSAEKVAKLKAAAAAGGYTVVEHKAVHSLHLKDRYNMTSHKLSFKETEAGLELRKISSDCEKLEIVAFCTNGSNDYRLKLLGQRDGPTGKLNGQLASIGARCKLIQGRLEVPSCPFVPDVARRKDKLIYSAVLDDSGKPADGGQEVRLTFTEVSEGIGESHNEVAITAPNLNAALNKGGANVDELLHRFLVNFQKLAAFDGVSTDLTPALR